MSRKSITTANLRAFKAKERRITMLTCYDATFARLLNGAGADVLLVGDSLGMVVQGNDSTLPVTMDDMVYHCRAVVRGRGAGGAHVVCDMPFMTYQTSPEDALRNAGRLMKEGAAESVKVEGGVSLAPTVARLVSAGIPVMGHIGLTPQSVHQLGGWKVQGKSVASADQLVADARALEAAGAYAIVVETVPADVGRRVTEAVSIPTIGIGAGPDCDGQVLVIYDMLGLNPDFTPRFLKRYGNLGLDVVGAVETYCAEVRDGAFPTADHSY
ncbi:MAG: 3-methyl-2-oxobutanoate hydroxymethyltransferase [Myxococcota bacterium]|jgi:3-methyl-2-oxobutanoate hydroxymethyltransferase